MVIDRQGTMHVPMTWSRWRSAQRSAELSSRVNWAVGERTLGRSVAGIVLVVCAVFGILFSPASALATPGDLDPTFGVGGKVVTDLGGDPEGSNSVAVLPGGQLVAVGSSNQGTPDNPNWGLGVVRYHPNGTLDKGFGRDGKVTASPSPPSFGASWRYGVKGIPDTVGGLYVGATYWFFNPTTNRSWGVVHYKQNGSIATAYGNSGVALVGFGQSDDENRDMIRLPDGTLVLCGVSRTADGDGQIALARLKQDGHLDFTFNDGGTVRTPLGPNNDVCEAVVSQPDGTLLVAATLSTDVDGGGDCALLRYSSNGQLDVSFGSGGVAKTGNVGTFCRRIVRQPGGRIVMAGSNFLPGRLERQLVLLGFTPQGALDDTFGIGGLVTTPLTAPYVWTVDPLFATDDGGNLGLTVQNDGKILALGMLSDGADCGYDGPAECDFAVARYEADGKTLDAAFGNAGVARIDFGGYDQPWDIQVQPADGRVVLTGGSTKASGSDFALARLLSVTRCGDGIVSASDGETCDDGDTTPTSGDGCSSTCQIEPGWSCPTPGKPCVASKCGDGIRAGSEQCDGTDDCKDDCTFNVCGDGVVRQGVEQCDDGNTRNSDDCKNDCTWNTCGDGVRHRTHSRNIDGAYGLEECDSPNDPLRCDAQCKRVPQCPDGSIGRCKQGQMGQLCSTDRDCDSSRTRRDGVCANECREGKVHAPCGARIGISSAAEIAQANQDCDTEPGKGDGKCEIEACDDGNLSDSDKCTNNCRLNVCGDGLINRGVEECDDGNTIDGDGCDHLCRKEAPPASCGDGKLNGTCTNSGKEGQPCVYDTTCAPDRSPDRSCDTEPGKGDGKCSEECDDGNNIDSDDCRNNCRLARCGDGVQHTRTKHTSCADALEECDSPNSIGCDDTCHTTCGNGRLDSACVGGRVGLSPCNSDADCDTSGGAGDGRCLAEQCDPGAVSLCAGPRCGRGRIGTSCTKNSDCDTSALAGDGVCAYGVVCARGRVGTPCAVDGDCDTAPGRSDGQCVPCTDQCLIAEPDCGNGRRECGEQCDRGALNGAATSDCRADCTLRPSQGGCSQQLTGWHDASGGKASRVQVCRADNDCFDPVSGQCTFTASLCVNDHGIPSGDAAPRCQTATHSIDFLGLDVADEWQRNIATDLTQAVSELAPSESVIDYRCFEGAVGKVCDPDSDVPACRQCESRFGSGDGKCGAGTGVVFQPLDDESRCTEPVNIIVPAGRKLRLRSYAVAGSVITPGEPTPRPEPLRKRRDVDQLYLVCRGTPGATYTPTPDLGQGDRCMAVPPVATSTPVQAGTVTPTDTPSPNS